MRTETAPHRRRAILVLALLMLLPAALGMRVPDALAAPASGGPGWSLRTVAQPTYFSSSSDTECERHPRSRLCDNYKLIVTNVGSASTTGSAVITDALPPGFTPVEIEGEDLGTKGPLACTTTPLKCSTGPVPPGDILIVSINVTVPGNAPAVVIDRSSVSGGGAPGVANSLPTTVSSERAPFGIADFNMQALDASGTPAVAAGAHPYELLTSFDLNTVDDYGFEGGSYLPPAPVRDVVVDLPLGLIGNPQVVPHCALHQLLLSAGESLCPAASRVGSLLLEKEPGVFDTSEVSPPSTTAIYNIEPEPGYPAEFGFTFQNKPVIIYASLAREGHAYKLRVTSPGIPAIGVNGTAVTFYGNPTVRNGTGIAPRPFFTNPTDCSSEPLKASVRVDSWRHPGQYTPPLESVLYPRITGCDVLVFQPTLKVTPDTTRADEPSGYTFEIGVPQEEAFETPATPELKGTTVTLPAGISVSPSAADGLRTCRETGPEGINIEGPEATEMGDGARNGSPYHDGQEHIAPGHCPAASTVGSVEIATPVLPGPLQGHIFLAEPKCGGAGQPECSEADATNGNLFGLYLEASGAGAIVKLHGTASANPATGQLTTTFAENPQLPFSALSLHFKDGPRATLANPQGCGQMTTTSDLVPWSSPTTPDATPLTSFSVDWDGNGGSCPGVLPLSPSFSAGTISPAAAAFSPFTLTLSRGDREQDLAQIAVHTPPGLLGLLAKVSLCEEPQAARGTCSPASQIGSSTAAAGSGPHPFWVQGGRVYLTGPYKGAPFGLSIVVPAVAGPFNLGNVVVRATVNTDPNTTALTITSDPLPQIIDGVPLRVRTVNVAVDRPGFMFNPTNCAKQQITGTVAGAQGALAPVSSPFTAIGCAGLPFKPKFSVSTQASTSKQNGASLDVKVTAAPGQANIAKVAVTLPRKLPSRLTTIQHACPGAVFAANPAACDPKSAIGIVTGVSPVLPVKLTGPAYLVSHGGAAFPDVVIILQGEGVRVDLTGNINIAGGVTSSTFASVPDVPIDSFELRLPESTHSALTAVGLPVRANGSLCGQRLIMPTVITGQNGAQIKQSTKIAVTGCPKTKKAGRKKEKAGRKKGTKAGSVRRRGGRR
jgi:hypothetical protein